MTRHYIKGIGRIVVEDASLVDLVRADMRIDELMIHVRHRRRSADMGYDVKFDRDLARQYASAIIIKRDVVAEICKRAKERRWQ